MAVGTVLTMTLVDVTERQQLSTILADQQTVVGMIFLDNYEEVVDNLDESRWPILSALIDRKLNQLAQDVDAYVKLEKTGISFCSQGMLAQLKDKKFDILNDIREISR